MKCLLWAVLLICAAIESRADRRSIVLSTDCGADMDDQWALAHLALSPEFRFLGVVTTHSPNLAAPAAETSARNSVDVLTHLPGDLHKKIPVIPGSSKPLESVKVPLMNDGVKFLLKQSEKFSKSHRLTILMIGAATDLGSALLADPKFQDRVEIISMGFLSWPEGGNEWNIHNDFRAWQVILNSRVPVVVGDGAVCKRYLLQNRESARRLFDSLGAPGKYLSDMLVKWLDQNQGITNEISGEKNVWPVWDSVTVAWILGLARAEMFPRPTMSDDMKLIHPAGKSSPNGTIRWIVEVDDKRLWADFAGKLRTALVDRD